jgi:hypothetical protein
VIDVVLAREDDRKEFVVAYLSRRLVDAEVRYTLTKKNMFASLLCMYKEPSLLVI